MKKKVLLMGASGSGKTSMRSLIFSNNPASLTARLGATIDVEQNHVRFLGDLILNLWDCGGQDAFMDSYLSTQRSTIFSHVGVMIYVFDAESRDVVKDLEYYKECLEALRKFSTEAKLFLLVHKMDLVRDKVSMLERKRKELQKQSGAMGVTVFGTSIYDESLYKAWSRIVHTLIPNVSVLSKHLTTLAEACSATEVILFERTTFLVIATSSPPTPPRHSSSSPPSPQSLPSPPNSPPKTPKSTRPTSPASPRNANTMYSSGILNNPTSHPDPESESDLHQEPDPDPDAHKLSPTRYERTSELIKSFKYSCSRFVREEFHSLEMELAEFTAVLDELTKNTYVMIVVHDPTIETAALKLNIRLARRKFEELQGDSLVSS